jgi:hypothetical protein
MLKLGKANGERTIEMTIEEIIRNQSSAGAIKFNGKILNGERDIRHELDISDRNTLHSNIKRGLEGVLDPVLASHLQWGGENRK